MVIVIGEYVIDLKEQIGDTYSSILGGTGLKTVTAVASENCPSLFVSPISQDIFGLKILDYLVENGIFFDPSLCNSIYPSTIKVSSLQEELNNSNYYINTASMMLNKNDLEEVLSFHSDIKAIHLGSLSMFTDPTSLTIYEVLSNLKKKPLIFLNPNLKTAQLNEISNFQEKIEKFLSLSTFVNFSKEELGYIYPELNYEETLSNLKSKFPLINIIVSDNDNITWYVPNNNPIFFASSDEQNIDIKGKNEQFVGSILSFFHNNGAFGGDMESPKFANDVSEIEKALFYSIKQINSIKEN